MNAFVQAVEKDTEKLKKKANVAYGENGMKAKKSSLNAAVDFYAAAGSVEANEILSLFVPAYREDPNVAMVLAFYLRDIRGGAQKRQSFRNILAWLDEQRAPELVKVIHLLPKYGRFDDMMFFKSDAARKVAIAVWSKELQAGNALAAKWIPRKPKVYGKDVLTFIKGLRIKMGFTSEKEWRRYISKMSNTVEQKMSAGQWREINLSHVPSRAMNMYKKAFQKRMPDEFAQYTQILSKPEVAKEMGVKVNASVLLPHEIVNRRNMHAARVDNNQLNLMNAQWEALPNFFPKDEEGNPIPQNILPMVDVSGSMTCKLANQPQYTCMDMSIAMGMYISGKNTGVWKDVVMTFSTRPELIKLNGNLDVLGRYQELESIDWGGSTDLEAAMQRLLDTAKKNNVPQSDMPTVLTIISDMNFNEATHIENNPTAWKMMRTMFKEAGYTMPLIVFWNANHNGSFAVKHDKNGAAMVSGYSPTALVDFLGNLNDLSPIKVMEKRLESYSDVWEALTT